MVEQNDVGAVSCDGRIESSQNPGLAAPTRKWMLHRYADGPSKGGRVCKASSSPPPKIGVRNKAEAQLRGNRPRLKVETRVHSAPLPRDARWPKAQLLAPIAKCLGKC